jgi:hypothetical protein
MRNSDQTNSACGRISHHVVIYSKDIRGTDLRPNLANLSPRPQEFGSCGELIARFADDRDAANHSAARPSVAVPIVKQPELITAKAEAPVI